MRGRGIIHVQMSRRDVSHITLYRGKYRVESARYQSWDYSGPGSYDVTICTLHHTSWFGEICEGAMHLSPIGMIVAAEWEKTPKVRPYVILDTWQWMPDHLHGILVIGEHEHGARKVLPFEASQVTRCLQAHSLGAIICQFKASCSKRIRAAGLGPFAWQPRFHDHVIRNEADLQRIREYIWNNVRKWEAERSAGANGMIE
jgi:putative transposase